MIYYPSDICANCGHPFSDHGGFYASIDPMTLEEPYRSHIDCKKIIGLAKGKYQVQCECCNFVPGVMK
jgi:DNA-directed RNA polymerase subunit RPC12/RpoP